MKKNYICIFFLACFSSINFAQTITNLRCKTIGVPDGTQTQYNEIGYYLDNAPMEYNGCNIVPSIIVAVIDSFCQPWNTCDHQFGQFNQFILTGGTCGNNSSGIGNCRARPENYFIFHFNNTVQMDSLNSMLNSIPNDNYILAYTWYTEMYSTIPAFINAFQNLGAVQISSLQDTMPYIFFMKKGDISTLQEMTGVHQNDSLVLNANLNCNTTGISELSDKYKLIFPNPVNDKLYISNINDKFNWEIFNATGQLILTGIINFSGDFINLKSIANGFYTIRIKDDKGCINKRFVKE